MRRLVPSLLLAASVTLVACDKDAAGEGATSPTGSTSATDATGPSGSAPLDLRSGFATPESTLWDPKADVIYVSNIQGSPLDRDDNGYISKLGPDGSVIEARWIDGAAANVELSAPKGLAILGDALAVADLDHVRFFDLATGAPLEQIAIPGATFVNDVAADGDAVLVTDSGMQAGEGGFAPSGTDAVYRVKRDGTIETLAKGPELDRPNGVLRAKDGRVLVVTFGEGKLLAVEGGKVNVVLGADALPGALDGLVETDGVLITSSWETKSLVTIDGTRVETLATELESPADIGYDAKRRRVLVPLFTKDAVVSVAR
jgi:sugar lactone lactonase YvrE